MDHISDILPRINKKFLDCSQEINARLSEIRACAASLPQGGDLKKLQAQLKQLERWVYQTQNYITRAKAGVPSSGKFGGFAY